MNKRTFLTAALVAIGFQAGAQTLATSYKDVGNGNPISPCVFCADPTAIDYQGRIYVYGTNDHQQYLVNGKSGSNGYGNIKSLVVFSTDDLGNWTFHGTIDVGKICGSWCGQSWAPSAIWRTNANGKEEFFIYFANGGGSVGAIRSTTSPVGPFSSPLSNAMIRHGMPGVDPCNWVFDPGVVIDDNGTGWIAFGGGDPQSTGSNLMPGNSRIAKLKPTMLGLDGPAVNLPAPYLFEASELNMMNGRYVYTYNTSWSDRNAWNTYAKRNGQPAPSTCSMCYMVTDNPLDPDAWEYRGEYVPNEGNFGMGWGNNHTHLHKFEGQYYLFYHSTLLEQTMKTGASGFRSIGVNKVGVNEETQKLNKVTMNKTGVTMIRNLDPYQMQQAETMSTCGGISYEDFTNITQVPSINTLGNDASKNLQVKMRPGTWTMVRKADFGTMGADGLTIRAKGKGTLEVRLNSRSNKASATLEFSSASMALHTIQLDPSVFKKVCNVFFVFTAAENVQWDSWQFNSVETSSVDAAEHSTFNVQRSTYDLSGRKLRGGAKGLVIERYTDEQGTVHSRKRLASPTE
jgi:arabinoxylan arabinofuranohydrolase